MSNKNKSRCMQDVKFIRSYYYSSNNSENHAHLIHSHDDTLEILYIYSGQGRYILDRQEYDVKEGDIVICNAKTLHGDSTCEDHKIESYCCAFTNTELLNLDKNHTTPIITLANHKENISIMFKLLHDIYSQEGGNKKIVAENIAKSIFYYIYDIFEHIDCNYKKETKKETLVKNIAQYIDENYMNNITLKEISEVFFISPSSLSHIFKDETGLSPMQYVINRRIGQAQSLLIDTNIKISEIEESLGFSSSCHFSALFKKHVGVSPKGYREIIK